MINNEKKELIKLLDSATISALMRLYGVTFKVLAVRFRCTRQNVLYLLQNNAFKEYQLEQLYDVFKTFGMNETDLVLIHHMANKRKGSDSK